MSTITEQEEDSFYQKLEKTQSIQEVISLTESLGKDDKKNKMASLKELLGHAVVLEFATIPIYLSAMWAIKDSNCAAAKSIRNILQEEMLHMSMVCNMLVAIGGNPKIYSGNRLSFPSYLPGGVHPELYLYLEGFNDCSLRNFMEIELPDEVAEIIDYETKEVVSLTPLCGSDKNGEEHPHQTFEHNTTIGALYTKIDDLFQDLQPEMNVERQLSGPLARWVMADASSVSKAIDFIKEQGEGSEGVTPESTGMDDLAHFYRFWEVYYEKKIVKEGDTYYFKDPFPRPDVFKIGRTPFGGYQEQNVTPEVWHLIYEFDKTYSRLVMLLEDAWTEGGGGQASLVKAVEVMFDLEKYALPLIATPIPSSRDGDNYGPCFRIIDVEK